MKKLLLFAALVIIARTGFSQTATTANDVAVAAFETTNFDFGKIVGRECFNEGRPEVRKNCRG